VAGPKILNRHNVKKVSENFIWAGNFFNMEEELKQLAESIHDKQAIKTLKIIKISKIVTLLSFVLFSVFFFVAI
jgi:hypothetical protein